MYISWVGNPWTKAQMEFGVSATMILGGVALECSEQAYHLLCTVLQMKV